MVPRDRKWLVPHAGGRAVTPTGVCLRGFDELNFKTLRRSQNSQGTGTELAGVPVSPITGSGRLFVTVLSKHEWYLPSL